MKDVFVPVVGMAPDDVVLTEWLRAPGDDVRDGDVVAVVETSKAEMEIAVSVDGVLGAQLYDAGATLAPGTTIATVLEQGDPPEGGGAPQESTAAATETTLTAGAADPSPVTLVDGAVGPSSPEVPDGGSVSDGPFDRAGYWAGDMPADRPRHTTSPRERRLAAKATSAAAGSAERLTPPPVDLTPPPDAGARESAAPVSSDGAPVPSSVSTELHDRFRAAISGAVTRSWHEIPHFTVSRELHVDALADAVRQWRVVIPQLTMTDLMLRAWALALLERHRRSDIDLGLAVATDRGVAIPVVRSVLRLGMVELVDARRAAVARARAGKLHADDAAVPVSTLSNLGAVGVDQFTGVVPYGQTDILTVGRAAERPVVVDHGLTIAFTMHATLNADHRVWDGWDAGQALARLAGVLAVPGLLTAPAAPPVTTPEKEDA